MTGRSRWQALNLRPEPHQQRSLRPGFVVPAGGPANDSTKALRQWAVKLLAQYSPVPFSAPAESALATYRLSLVPGAVQVNLTDPYPPGVPLVLVVIPKNVTLVPYDPATQTITQATGVTGTFVGNANGARVALENSNPYDGPVGAAMKAPLFLTPLLNLFGLSTPGTANVSVSAVAVIKAVPALPATTIDSFCDGKTHTLEFNGGSDNAAWTTYNIANSNATDVRDLFDALPSCEGQPDVDTGYCTNLTNGTIGNVFNTTLPNLFNRNPGKCYLMPVIPANTIHFNMCRTITDWASFCPCSPSRPCANGDTNAFPSNHELQGDVTCGQTPYTSKDSSCYVPRLVRDTKSGM